MNDDEAEEDNDEASPHQRNPNPGKIVNPENRRKKRACQSDGSSQNPEKNDPGRKSRKDPRGTQKKGSKGRVASPSEKPEGEE